MSSDVWSGETEIIDDGYEPLRQGDIFLWDKRGEPWRRVGIVVTANCDIAWGKFGGIISYVPVLTVKDYWRLVRLPTLLLQLYEQKFLPFVIEQVRGILTKSGGDVANASDYAIKDFLDLMDSSSISGFYSLSSGDEERLRDIIGAYRKAVLVGSKSDCSFDEVADAYIGIKSIIGKKESIDSLKKSLAEGLSQLPGDAFFIGRMVGVQGQGFVACLRVIRETKMNVIAVRPSDYSGGEIQGRRVSRVTSPYIYRITQQLGQVFSDIGLPEKYEAFRRSISSSQFDGGAGA